VRHIGEGYIKLHRQINDHWIWQRKPFSPGQAWIDILLMVNHDTAKFPFGNEIIEVERGECITSETKLASKWGWSRHKVRDFLSLLESDSMLVKKSDTKRTSLKVLNYNVWQDSSTAEGQQKDSKRTGEGQVRNTNKNEKNDKNDKKYINISPQLETAIEDFKEYRKKIKKPMTDRAVELLIDKLNKLASNDETKIAILNQSIVNGWQGIFPLKQDTSPEKSKSSNPFFELLKEEGKL
jgi:DNA replication protein DnaD